MPIPGITPPIIHPIIIEQRDETYSESDNCSLDIPNDIFCGNATTHLCNNKNSHEAEKRKYTYKEKTEIDIGSDGTKDRQERACFIQATSSEPEESATPRHNKSHI